MHAESGYIDFIFHEKQNKLINQKSIHSETSCSFFLKARKGKKDRVKSLRKKK